MSSRPEEILNIIEALGRKDLTEGNVRGTHLGKILNYLQMKGTEDYEDTLYKLALVCGVNIRYIRENYLKGLELFGVIKVRMEKNAKIWKWNGDKDICNNGSDIKKIVISETPFTDSVKEKEKKK